MTVGKEERTGEGRKRSKPLAKWALFILLIGVNLLFLFTHELFRDEAQAWLMAKELSLPALIKELSYEGHPCLWYLLLMPFAKLGFPYQIMNILCFLFMTAVLYLLLFRSSLPKTVILLCCSAYYLHSFSVVGRNYACGILLLMTVAMVYPQRKKRPYLYLLLVALLLQTHILFAGLCLFLTVLYFWETLSEKRKPSPAFLFPAGSGALLLIEFAQVLHSTVFTLYVPKKQGEPFWEWFLKAGRLLSPLLPVTFWLTLVVFGVLVFLRKKELRGFWLAVLATCFYMIFVSSRIYPWGRNRIMILGYLILFGFQVIFSSGKDKILSILSSVMIVLMWTGSLFQLTVGIHDVVRPYSGAKETAAFLDNQKEPVVSASDDYNNGVALQVKKQKLFNPFTGYFSGFCHRKTEDIRHLSFEELVRIVDEQFPDQDILIVISKELSEEFSYVNLDTDHLTCVFSSAENVIDPERFLVYRLSADDPVRNR